MNGYSFFVAVHQEREISSTWPHSSSYCEISVWIWDVMITKYTKDTCLYMARLSESIVSRHDSVSNLTMSYTG